MFKRAGDPLKLADLPATKAARHGDGGGEGSADEPPSHGMFLCIHELENSEKMNFFVVVRT